MQISSIVELIDGELQNSPSISFIYDIKTELKKIHEGDLYIAKDPDCIAQALENGAFAIVYDFYYDISDDEIAWIKVKDLEFASIKLLRYLLLNKKIKSFYVNKILLNMIDVYKNDFDDKAVVLTDDIYENINLVKDIDDDNYLFSANKDQIFKIYSNSNELESQDFSIANFINNSLFETTFSYKDRYFSRIKLPALYINELLTINEYFVKEIDLSKLKKFNYFKPIFVDKFLNITDFGKTDKFILSCLDIALAYEEIKYLTKNYSYGEIIVLMPYEEKENQENLFFYKDNNEIKDILNNISFNAVYIIGRDNSDIIELLQKSRSNNLLF